MHIKKLEITGFKSFVDRTVIHFDHDVVGIVGPNGCGKSNIVDAVRWCLGEQSAKHLRGRAMEDVIFNGSESRGPAGLSEVTLTFDNTNPDYAATLPLEYRDYPEIAVTRRLYRDGTSEYLLNKTQVRLRDVTELFLGTGVGTKAYSVVEQGRIGQIVSSRPEDRRLFIEEAAGVTKYKQRRKQAERKIELTRQNLLRLTDIVSEIDHTRASLKRQVAKAERFIEYRRELDDLVLHQASHRLLELLVTERVEWTALCEARAQTEHMQAELAKAESTLRAARDEASEVERRADEASQRAFESDNEVTGLQAEVERSQDRLGHLSERFDAANTELEVSEARRTGLCAEASELSTRIAELTVEERQRESAVLTETEALSGLQREEGLANDAVSGLRRRASELGAQVAGREATLVGMERSLREGRSRRDRLTNERQSLTSEIADGTARESALAHHWAEFAEGEHLSSTERRELGVRLDSLRVREQESERATNALRNELGLKHHRLRALEDLHRRLQGVGAGARALLSTPDPRVLGLLADRLEAPQELTLAVAGLLGDRLECVVVSDSDACLTLLEELRQGKRGRAEVVAARPFYVAGGSRCDCLADPRVLGYLRDRLSFAPEDEALVLALVGDAVITESAVDALAVGRRYAGLTAVALDGTVVRPDGVVSGGTEDGVAAAMLDQKREVHLLTGEVARLETEHSELAQKHQALRTELSELGSALDQARQKAHQAEIAKLGAEKDLARTRVQLESHRARFDNLDVELSELDRSLENAELAEAQAHEQLLLLKAELGQLQTELGQAELTAQGWRGQVAVQASSVTERKVRLAQIREQLESSRRAEQRALETLSELEAKNQLLGQELEDNAAARGQTESHIALTRQARVTAQEEARKAHQTLESARGLLEEVRGALGGQETWLRQLRTELGQVETGCRKHELSVQRSELERSHLLNSIRERFRGLDLNRVVGDYHARPAPDPEHHRRIQELQQLIDRMGPVNLDARAEFESAERRFAELSGQKTDVEKALEELEQAIRHMNRESKRRFKDTFDSVNALFRKTFARLFRGGRAELVLTNPEDLLDSGVDIIAQPPGKKLGNIELMSGGEKALTAVSLIFAIFQHRPSPFCVLDEVDAPLDDANVTRYNELVRMMTDNSQFILITHVKKTMQSVDVLYGVTMGEPGVSRIVSVKVNQNAVNRSDARATQNGNQDPELPQIATGEVA